MSIAPKKNNYIRNTFISGIIFLIPLVALGWLFGGAIGSAIAIITKLQQHPWIKSHGGLLLLLPLAAAAVVVFVFVLGLLVRLTILGHAKKWAEQQLLDMMPGYNFLKLRMEEKLNIKEKYIPVLVQLQSSQQVGIQVDKKEELVVVFFPNGTLVRGGTIHVVNEAQVKQLPYQLDRLEGILNNSGEGLLEQAG